MKKIADMNNFSLWKQYEYLAHRRVRDRLYNAENKDKVKKRNKTYYDKHYDKKLSLSRKYYAANPKKRKNYYKIRYWSHLEEMRAYNREYMKKWRKKHREDINVMRRMNTVGLSSGKVGRPRTILTPVKEED